MGGPQKGGDQAKQRGGGTAHRHSQPSLTPTSHCATTHTATPPSTHFATVTARHLPHPAPVASAPQNPLTRGIRALENRLDKAIIKYNEAQSIRKTYEQITKRLKDERITFDNQLVAIEKTLKAKEHDYEELLLMAHDANHAKEAARAELARFEQAVAEERRQREKELNERRAQARARQEMMTRAENREKMRQEIILEAQG